MVRRGVMALLAACVALVPAARAEDMKLRLGYSFISEFMPAFVAADNGVFARNGIAMDMVGIANPANIPAAVTSRSIDIAGLNIATLLHAVDGGLDMVVIAGSSMIPNKDAPIAYVTGPDWSYAGPESLAGRSVAMPGIGSAVDVLFRVWVQGQKMDLQKIRIVEVPLPQIPDGLRTHSVDSAVLVEPFLTRAVQGGQAKMGVRFTDTLPHAVIAILYAADRGWADAHRKEVTAFRAAVANPAQGREALGHYIKLPPEALAVLPTPTMTPTVSVEQVAWWVDQMKAQGFLQNPVDPSKLIWK